MSASCSTHDEDSEDECCSACSGILAAYRDEIHKLSGVIELHARDNVGLGALEGRYLEQVKKCRTLRVQLDQTKNKVRELEDQLGQASLSRSSMSEAAHASERETQKKMVSSPKPLRRDSNHAVTSSSITSMAQTKSKSGAGVACTGNESVRVLRERLNRVYKQLHERDNAVEDVRRQCHRLIALVSQEVGINKDEVMRLLAQRSNSLHTEERQQEGQENSPGRGRERDEHSSIAQPGWRGRATQIVLLKTRVKDLERALDKAQCSSSNKESNVCECNARQEVDVSSEVACKEVYPAIAGILVDANSAENTSRVRGAALSTAGSVNTTSVANRVDVDDSAREAVDRVVHRRLCTVRELESVIAHQAEEIRAVGQRYAGAQGRLLTVQRELRELKSYVAVILDKSQTDDELLELYRNQLREVQEAAEAARRAHEAHTCCDTEHGDDGNSNSNGSSNSSNYGMHARNTNSQSSSIEASSASAAAAKKECIRLRSEVTMLESKLRCLAALQTADTSTHLSRKSQTVSSNEDESNLLHWVRAAVDAVQASRTAKQLQSVADNTPGESKTSSLLMMVQVGEFLDAAQRHARAVEAQVQLLEDKTTTHVLERCMSILARVESRFDGKTATAHTSTTNKNCGATRTGGSNSSTDACSTSLCEWLDREARDEGGQSHDNGPRLATVVLKENAALKQRVRTLTLMAQYEARAHQARFDHLLEEYRSAAVPTTCEKHDSAATSNQGLC